MKIMLAIGLSAALSLAMGVAPGSTSDDKIESSLTHSYVWKTYLKNDSVMVKAKDGVVTLTGSVSEEYHRSLAEETALDLPAVTRVDNRVEVVPTRGATSNDWTTAKVKATLLFHSKVSAGTEVTVKNGVVTLAGPADSASQKKLTGEYALRVDGVTEVRNNLTVSNAPSSAMKEKDKTVEEIDDASITAEVKMALLFDRSTSSLKTTVKTTDGVVTLTGKATTTVARDEATRLAGDLKGVKSVRNRMTE